MFSRRRASLREIRAFKEQLRLNRWAAALFVRLIFPAKGPKSRTFATPSRRDGKGERVRGGSGVHAAPVGGDVGPEPQEETDASEDPQGAVLRRRALPQGAGGQPDQPPRGDEPQAGDGPDERREANNGPGQAEPAAGSPGDGGRKQVLGDQQPCGDHAAADPAVRHPDLVR